MMQAHINIPGTFLANDQSCFIFSNGSVFWRTRQGPIPDVQGYDYRRILCTTPDIRSDGLGSDVWKHTPGRYNGSITPRGYASITGESSEYLAVDLAQLFTRGRWCNVCCRDRFRALQRCCDRTTKSRNHARATAVVS